MRRKDRPNSSRANTIVLNPDGLDLPDFPNPQPRAVIIGGLGETRKSFDKFITLCMPLSSKASENSKASKAGLFKTVEFISLPDAYAHPERYIEIVEGNTTVIGHSYFMAGLNRIIIAVGDESESLPQQIIAFDPFEKMGLLKLFKRSLGVGRYYRGAENGLEKINGFRGKVQRSLEVIKRPLIHWRIYRSSKNLSSTKELRSFVEHSSRPARSAAIFFSRSSEYNFESAADPENLLPLKSGNYRVYETNGRHNKIVFEPKKTLEEMYQAFVCIED